MATANARPQNQIMYYLDMMSGRGCGVVNEGRRHRKSRREAPKSSWSRILQKRK